MKRDKEKINKYLGRKDPIEFWLKDASIHCQRLKLRNVPIVEALAIVKNTFGDEWIEKQINVSKKITPFSDRHPVASWIFTPGVHQVCSILELANYFREMYSLPKFNEVIEMMKIETQCTSSEHLRLNKLIFS